MRTAGLRPKKLAWVLPFVNSPTNFIGAGAKAGFVGKGKDRNRVILNPGESTDMKNVFSFYKEYCIKVMLTLENGF